MISEGQVSFGCATLSTSSITQETKFLEMPKSSFNFQLNDS